MTEAVINIEQVKVPRLLKVGYCLLFWWACTCYCLSVHNDCT